MNSKLLASFLSEDGDAQARRKLLDTIREHKTTRATVVRKYTFNRFKVTLDFGTDYVTLEDDLTIGPQGEYKLGVEEFEKALLECN
ncbi:MAG: hypothetical protein WCS42_19445 [Verrucomicrobiota bacterium]